MSGIRQTAVRVVFASAALGAISLLAPPGSAHAGLDGNCEASGDFVAGTKADGPLTIDAKSVGSETIVIPRSDTVNWSGAVETPAEERPYSGSIVLELPLGATIEIDSWSGTSDRVSNSGTKEYDLPSAIPAGITYTVSGEHTEPGATCTGSVKVKIEGGAFDSPVAPGALGLTAATGIGMAFAIKPLFRRVLP